MKNYIVPDGCWNCEHVFKRYDYDEPDEYFCTFNAPKRPLCMSVSMSEDPDNNEVEWEEWEEWEAWEE